MPLYEYICSGCGLKFESRKQIDQREHALCPQCGKQGDKIISVVNHTFGFRLTDESHLPGHPDEFERDV